MNLLKIFLFSGCFFNSVFAFELLDIEMRPGQTPNTVQALVRSRFEAGERIARVEVHATYLESDGQTYTVVEGTDATNNLEKAWFYHPPFLGFKETVKETSIVVNNLTLPLSGLFLGPGLTGWADPFAKKTSPSRMSSKGRNSARRALWFPMKWKRLTN